MAAEAELAFKALDLGVDKIPNSALDHVPGYRPPKEVRQQRKEEKRRRKQGLPHGDPYYHDDNLDPDRRYPDSVPRDPDELYGSRPLRDPQQAEQNYYQPPRGDYRRGYNPADYRPSDDYYNGGGGYGGGYDRDQYMSPPSRDHYGRSASVDVPRHRSSYDDDRDHGKSSSGRSRGDRSNSRFGGVKDKIDKNFTRDKEGLTSSALGAIAGGLVGHEVGKGTSSAVMGALIGGLGANAWETREMRQKSRNRSNSQSRSRSRSRTRRTRAQSTNEGYSSYQPSSRQIGPASYGSQGGSRDRGDVSGDDDYEARRLNKEERRRRRRERELEDEEREANDRCHKWSHILKT